MKIIGIEQIMPEAALATAQGNIANLVQTLCILAFLAFLAWSVKLVFE
jgi:flagellar biogenesis protein FliO